MGWRLGQSYLLDLREGARNGGRRHGRLAQTGSTFSGVGASGKPGAVQPVARLGFRHGPLTPKLCLSDGRRLLKPMKRAKPRISAILKAIREHPILPAAHNTENKTKNAL